MSEKEFKSLREDLELKFQKVESILREYKHSILSSLSIDTKDYLNNINISLKKIDESIVPYHLQKRNYIVRGLTEFLKEVEKKIAEFQKKKQEKMVVILDNNIIEWYISEVWNLSTNSESQNYCVTYKSDKEIKKMSKNNKEDEKMYLTIRDMIRSFAQEKQKEWIIIDFGEISYPLKYPVVCEISFERKKK